MVLEFRREDNAFDQKRQATSLKKQSGRQGLTRRPTATVYTKVPWYFGTYSTAIVEKLVRCDCDCAQVEERMRRTTVVLRLSMQPGSHKGRAVLDPGPSGTIGRWILIFFRH